MASPEVKSFTEMQFKSLQAMDESITEVLDFIQTPPRNPVEISAARKVNEIAFEHYYSATRPERLKVDPDAVIVASGRLLHRGLPQFVKHQPLENFDSFLKGKRP